MDSYPQDNIGAQTKRYAAAIASLTVEFNERFRDFAAIEKDVLLFCSPFSVDLDDAPHQLQLKLIELQCDIEGRSRTQEAFSCELLPAAGQRPVSRNLELVRLHIFV